MTADIVTQSREGTASFLSGGGRAGELIGSTDWSRSSLGHFDAWPQSLRSIVGLMLTSKFAMFVAWGPDLCLLYNDAYMEILGDKHPASLGARLQDVWAEVWDEIGPLTEGPLRGEAIYRDSLPLTLNRFGYDEPAWFTFSYSPVRDESDAVAGLFCAVSETTVQVRAQRRQAFRLALEEQLRSLTDPVDIMATAAEAIGKELDVGRVGYGEVEESGVYVHIARDWADARMGNIAGDFRLDDFGREMIGALRAGHSVAIPDVETDARTAAAAEAFSTIATRGLLAVPLIKGGRFRAVLYLHHFKPRRWSDDDIELVAEVAERTWATVERARAEAALAGAYATLEDKVATRTAELSQSEQRFRAIFDTTFQLTGLGKLDGTILLVNQAALDAIRAPQEHITGLKVWDAPWWAHAPEEQVRVRDAVARAATGEFVRYEASVLLPIGLRTFDFSMKPILDEDGKPAFLLAEARDITEQKFAEDSLRQSQKMEAVGQLTGGIAHDFNNLLGAVIGSFDLIQRNRSDAEKITRLVEAGLKAAERGAKLTGQLLTFSRSQRVETKPLLIEDLVEGMGEILARALGPLVHLKLEIVKSGLPVLSDATQLEMAILNLAINARDAMEDGGDLTICVDLRRLEGDPELPAGRYVEITVTDTGSGMTPEVLDKAVDPFFTTKGVGKGTGLGLSQVYGIARQSGGTLRLESHAGEGTVARVLLPVAEGTVPEQARRIADEDLAMGDSASILVIDDDPDVRRMLVDTLENLGYKAASCSDGPSGIAALGVHLPDLVLVDFAMPGMNGAEVARAIWQLHPAMPILFASGYSNTAAIEAVAGEDVVVLRKPFRIDDLQRALLSALSR